MAIERKIWMRSKVLGLAAAGAVVMTASLAYAGTTSPQTASYSNNTNWGVPTLVELNFAGFDGSLGTLTGVTVSVLEEVSGTVQNTNTGNDASGIDSWLVNTWTVYLPSALNSVSHLTGTSASADQYDDLDPGATGDVVTVTGSSNGSAASAASNDLTAYKSAFTVTAKDLGGVTVSADNGNGQSAYTDTGTITVSVTYTYDAPPPPPVPEPATLAILGGGLFGLGLVRRRRG
ncbi:MAG: choice-of-anchor E domain-containing protein [Rhodopila sp.]